MIMLGLMEQNREMGIGGVGDVKGGGGTRGGSRCHPIS